MSASGGTLARGANPIALVGRMLPRGWADFALQLAIFASFNFAYEFSRSFAQGKGTVALRHAHAVVQAERSLGIFYELEVQRWAMRAPGIVMDLANWTYFNCQFTISLAFLLWVYIRRNACWAFVRNTVIAADFLAVIGYIGYPTAPPRMLVQLGFVDTLDDTVISQHSSGIAALANPYAAMPSLHTAYALILGVTGVVLARHQLVKAIWALYPALVVFSIVATANHFFLDAVAGLGDLLLALAVSLSILALRRRKTGPIVLEPAAQRSSPVCPSE